MLTQIKDKSPKSDEASGSTSAKNDEESMSTLHQQPLEILESNPDNDQNKKKARGQCPAVTSLFMLYILPQFLEHNPYFWIISTNF